MKLPENIERWPIEKLVPYARNARTHTDAQVAQIAASMKEWGWTNPVLVSEDGTIIAGHGRVLAARMLGLPEAPCIVARDWSDAQKRAYVLADNKLAENAGWDEELLRLELEEIRLADFDLGLIGFDPDALKDLLEGLEEGTEGLTDDDEVPDAQGEVISKSGDLWLLGDHKVFCGDATVPENYFHLLGEEQADMVFTDPPYNVNYANSPKDKMRGVNRPILNDNLGDDFGSFIQSACQNFLDVTQGAVYIAMSSSELDRLQFAFRAAGGHWSTFVIWAKNTFTLGRADYQRQYEPILYGWREGTTRHWCGARDQGAVWQVNKPLKNDLHPTMKPVELVERAIRNSSKSKDIVLDPFGGSGSTLIACEKTGRRARLMELDPVYVDVIIRRWQNFSGKQAFHAETGRLFPVSIEQPT